jgi:crotonobetainyl-CoA:carnitine CoA-transferase CaiB-like acyl-CoA transferase
VSSAQPPLADVRVIAVEQYGAGPWATLQLADLGAEVIKIEDPSSRGDVGRYVPPFQEQEDSLFFETFNHNKRSVSLDLRRPEGRTVFEDLVRHADAVYSNLRGDQPAKLRLTYDDLKEINPKIVCVSLSGFGMTGPRATEAGYDYVMQAMAGWMSLTGDPDGPPTKSGLSLVDLSGGYVSAIALLAGLHRARRDGVGCDADISLFETALHELMYVGTWAATAGYEPQRMPDSAHPSIVPFQAFQTADGWITVACAKQKFWERLCDVLDRRDLLEDPRFADFAGRNRHRDALLPQLVAILRERTTADWAGTLTAAGVPNGPVNTVAQALEDSHTVARGAVVSIEHPRFGEVRQAASPLRLSGPSAPLRRAPLRGEDTESVLTAVCGYSAERVTQLRAAGAFGSVGGANDGERDSDRGERDSDGGERDSDRGERDSNPSTMPVADRPKRRAASDG